MVHARNLRRKHVPSGLGAVAAHHGMLLRAKYSTASARIPAHKFLVGILKTNSPRNIAKHTPAGAIEQAITHRCEALPLKPRPAIDLFFQVFSKAVTLFFKFFSKFFWPVNCSGREQIASGDAAL